MRISLKRFAALLALLCITCAGHACFRDAAPSNNTASEARGVLSAETPTRNENIRAEAESLLPPPNGFVNDYANVFDRESKRRLESVLNELKDKSEIEFALVTVETTEGRPIADYSLALAKSWGVGPEDKSKGGGLLLLLALKEREWRIQVSRNLEKDLPDDECKRLGERSVESYREGKYAEGLTKYVGAIIGKLEEARGFKLSKKLGDG